MYAPLAYYYFSTRILNIFVGQVYSYWPRSFVRFFFFSSYMLVLPHYYHNRGFIRYDERKKKKKRAGLSRGYSMYTLGQQRGPSIYGSRIIIRESSSNMQISHQIITAVIFSRISVCFTKKEKRKNCWLE